MQASTVRTIPIADINIINPRTRRQIIAEGIRQNIDKIGLKRPITVTVAHGQVGKYDLVCGQGRLEAFIAAGETEIPAIVLGVNREEALLMSLVENVARGRGNALETLQSIKYLRSVGYSHEDIALKTDLNPRYVASILHLIDHGEEYLVNAVENGRIPLRIAMSIASKESAIVREELTRAYENKEISGEAIKRIDKCIARRDRYGRKLYVSSRMKSEGATKKLIEKYEHKVKHKEALLQQSNYIQQCMAFVAGAFENLLNDLHFTNQLEVAQLCEVPERLLSMLGEQQNDY